ncbi:MAG: hypothetical protein JST01_17915 [Cyanobacteria bacterium SZAS TMP-1]|nr:hypothetical protein [Cyanobacteria bacterium SZAS TMP-1]
MFKPIISVSARTKVMVGVGSALIVTTVMIYTLVVTFFPADYNSSAARGPVTTAAEAINRAEECMRNSGYAGTPAKDYWPRGDEFIVVLAGRGNLAEMRQSRALLYEPKAAAYEEFPDRWIVGFPNRGGGDLGVQVMVYKTGRMFILHDPPSQMSYFKIQIK